MKLLHTQLECKETQDTRNLASRTFVREQTIILTKLTLTWLFKIKLMKCLKSRKRQSPRKIFREVMDQVFILQTFINLLTSIFTKLMETLLIRKIWRAM